MLGPPYVYFLAPLSTVAIRVVALASLLQNSRYGRSVPRIEEVCPSEQVGQHSC
jgi:hypothetical protein